MQNLSEIILAAQNYMSPQDVEVIVYHHPCPDGAAGAFAGWWRFGDKNVVYTPYLRQNINDGVSPFDEELLQHKNVLFIDCAPSLDELARMRKYVKNLMVLDHHVSAAQELNDQEGCFFTDKNSGAVIAWHYFWGLHKKLPELFILIQDRDLLQWHKREQSAALDAAITAYNPNFDFKFFKDYIDDQNLERLISLGNDKIHSDTMEVERLVNSAQMCTYFCPATNKTYNIKCVELKDYSLTLQVSELLRQEPGVDFCMSWYHEGNDIYRVSMRTAKDQLDVDLSVISKHFAGDKHISGGGHANKAGCRVVGAPNNYLVVKQEDVYKSKIKVGP